MNYNRETQRPRRFVDIIRDLNEMQLTEGPEAFAARERTDEEIAILENGAGFIPIRYCPISVSEELARQMHMLVDQVRWLRVPSSCLWGTEERPGILPRLIATQRTWSARRTDHIRVEIVKRARDELWRSAYEHRSGLFTFSFAINVMYTLAFIRRILFG